MTSFSLSVFSSFKICCQLHLHYVVIPFNVNFSVILFIKTANFVTVLVEETGSRKCTRGNVSQGMDMSINSLIQFNDNKSFFNNKKRLTIK